MFEGGGRGLGGAKVDLESVGVAGECVGGVSGLAGLVFKNNSFLYFSLKIFSFLTTY